jgi:predicted  nucleic acid-binding Zn-ribbon protein
MVGSSTRVFYSHLVRFPDGAHHSMKEDTMRAVIAIVALCSLVVAGCSNQEKEEALQKQLALVQSDKDATQKLLSERDLYLEGVMKEINDIYTDLEKARMKEGTITRKAQGVESKQANLDSRKQLLDNIQDIGSALKDNRKRIGDLQARVRTLGVRIAALDTLIVNLKNTLEEREQAIAQLQGRVQGLEQTVAEKTATIAQKENQLNEQRRKLNTVYYVAGSRAELEEKGIISEEGGFLWGLLGSTTVMSAGPDPAEFTALDKSKDNSIHIAGKIGEILPHRQDELFATSAAGESESDLKILEPDKFWRNQYLVVVLD